MFKTHTHFIDSIQQLALSPKIVNIDRIRIEHYDGDNIITRSTREWSNSLKTTAGTPLRCDAKNGGQDRRAYLLVPTPHLADVKIEFQKYLHALTTASARNTHNQTDKTPIRPTEIYIPTPAVLTNLRILNTLSSEQIWKCAPATIRTPIKTRDTSSPASGRGQEDNHSRSAAKHHQLRPTLQPLLRNKQHPHLLCPPSHHTIRNTPSIYPTIFHP